MIAQLLEHNPALADPYKALTPAERTFLRKLEREGPAVLVAHGHGWMLAGTRYAAKPVKRLIDKDVVYFFKDVMNDGLIKLNLNGVGRQIAERIALRHTKPGLDDLPDD
jgi:hypothetical protein